MTLSTYIRDNLRARILGGALSGRVSLRALSLHYGTSLTPEAVQTQYDVMRDPMAGPRHRLAAAQDHMDRFGIPKISRQENENKTPTMIVVNLLPSQRSQFALPQPTIEAEVVMLPPEVSSANDE